MGKTNFAEEFKQDAVKQITERRYSVADVSKRLWVSSHPLCGWMKRYGALGKASPKDDQTVEIRRLKRGLARVTEERDILKKSDRVFRQRYKVKYAFIKAHRTHFNIRVHMPYASCLSERVLRLAEATAQQSCSRRCTPDGTA